MPWTARSGKKHNKNADADWARIANNALKKYGDDATAIKVANAAKKKIKEKKRA